ncbi:MAG: glycosyltransferase family 9 protein [Verrucomicrobiota bacterium]
MGRILILRGGAVGDFLLTLPALRTIKKALPEVRLEIIGYPAIAEVALATGIADAIRPIERASMAALFTPGAAVEQELVDYLRSFQIVISYLDDPLQVFASNLERLDIGTFVQGPSKIDETLQPPLHAVHQLSQPMQRFALFLEEEAPLLSFPETTSSGKLAERIRQQPTLAFHPGSGSPRKNWPLAHWKDLLEKFLESHPGWQLLQITGETELERRPELESAFTHLPRLQADCLPLPSLGHLLAHSQHYLGHDTGVSHLAALAGVSSTLLFGPSHPEVWQPPHRSCHVLPSPGQDLKNLKPEIVFEVLSKDISS